MNKKQERAAESLKKALGRCAAAGLRGGVYEGSFCIWPISGIPDPLDGPPRDFFGTIHEYGVILHGVKMMLDGGAGS